jgi:uncharacterized protein YgbK (DUF1537 family)
MPRIVIIADDPTGANGTCSLLRKLGFSSACLVTLKEGEIPKGYDSIAGTTNSRAYSPQDAADAVRRATAILQSSEVLLYNKRTDSTLRGNMGAETQAMLEELGDDRIAIAVPAYPNTNRTVEKGIMRVHGQLLVESDAGHDAKMPVTSSNVAELLAKDFHRPVRSVFLEEIEQGSDAIARIIKAEKEKGVGMLVFDALTNEHISILAKGALLAGVPFIAVDPGPFTRALAAFLPTEPAPKILMVVGSVTDSTMRQLQKAKEELAPTLLSVDAARLIDPAQRERDIAVAAAQGEAFFKQSDLLLLTSAPDEREGRVNLQVLQQQLGIQVEESSYRINTALADIARGILLRCPTVKGLFVTGGDILVAVCRALSAPGMQVIDEVEPLAAYGKLIGGDCPGLRLVTKGGMVGNDEAMIRAVRRLRREIIQEPQKNEQSSAAADSKKE